VYKHLRVGIQKIHATYKSDPIEPTTTAICSKVYRCNNLLEKTEANKPQARPEE